VRVLRGLLSAAFLPLFVGCYTYGTAPGEQVPESGKRVRAQLTEEEASELQSELGIGVDRVFGSVLTSSGESVTIATRRGGQGRVDAFGALRDSVTIPVSAVETWETQQFSLLRTAGVVAAGGAAVVMFARLAVDQSGEPPDRGPLGGGGGEGSIAPPGLPEVQPRSGDKAGLSVPVWIAWSVPVP